MADHTDGRLRIYTQTPIEVNSILEGIGYAHTMSSPGAPPRQPKKSSTIQLRWTAHWEPQCMLASKHAHDPADAFRIYRESYDRRIGTLFRAGIPWQSILRSDLDSPLQSGLEFDRALTLAIVRRGSRMGRQKGKGKKYDSSHRNSR